MAYPITYKKKESNGGFCAKRLATKLQRDGIKNHKFYIDADGEDYVKAQPQNYLLQ